MEPQDSHNGGLTGDLGEALINQQTEKNDAAQRLTTLSESSQQSLMQAEDQHHDRDNCGDVLQTEQQVDQAEQHALQEEPQMQLRCDEDSALDETLVRKLELQSGNGSQQLDEHVGREQQLEQMEQQARREEQNQHHSKQGNIQEDEQYAQQSRHQADQPKSQRRAHNPKLQSDPQQEQPLDERQQTLPDNQQQQELEGAQEQRSSASGIEGAGPMPSAAGEVTQFPTRQGKRPKHAKKHSSKPQSFDASLGNETIVAPALATSHTRVTEFLFDKQTATALESLCALQVNTQVMETKQQGPTVSFSAAPSDDKELVELEQCFVFDDDATQAQTLEKNRAERLQRVESLRTVAIIRQTLTTEKAFQGLQDALTTGEVVVGFARDTGEARACLAAQGETTKKQEHESLQSQADRLYKQAQELHDRIMKQVKEKHAQFKASRKLAAREHAQRKSEISRTLEALQTRLEAILQHRRLDLLSSYGFLKKDSYTTNFSLRAKIPSAVSKALGLERGAEGPNWRLMPQILRLRLDMCRAVKDGVPRGQYVMMISVWNRLGGHRLLWSYICQDRSSSEQGKQNEGAEQKRQGGTASALATGSCAVSAPVAFAAMYFSECLRFDETVYLNCPSETDIKPSMCLVFQLYLLRGAVSPVDKVVAWGAFPLVGPEGRIVEGSFKVPLFLGEVDTSLQRYIDMEHKLRSGLDAWLCNLYFRTDRLPKEVDGLQEFEVPLHYTGRLLNIPYELPLPKEFRGTSSLRIRHSSRGSHNSTNSLGRSSVRRILRDMQPNRDTIKDPFEERHTRHRALSYGMRPFPKVSEQELARYQYGVITEQTLLHRGVTRRKLRHILNELIDEFSMSSDVKEISLAGAALLFALAALWLAVLLTLFGSWVALKACSIPVYSAEIKGLYIRFGYVQELLSLRSAALFAASGFVAALVVFAVLCAVAHLVHCFVGRLPNAAYRFMAPLGVWVLLLPIVLAIIEGVGGESSGMTFALYVYLKRENSAAPSGVLLTILMDIAFMAISSVLFYYYVVAIHHNGRVLDCYRRVTAESSAFRFPSDTQVSERYMKACCYKAKQFLGLEGETRRVQVTQFRVLPSDSHVEKSLDKQNNDLLTTYVAIFTVHPTTKQQTLYRHFLRHPDGTIVEQLYSTPLSLEFSASGCPAEVTQRSFEETGFLQHQPVETVLSFEEWRSHRFGNMPPAVILDYVGEKTAEHNAEKSLPLKYNEAPTLMNDPQCILSEKNAQAFASAGNDYGLPLCCDENL